MAKPKKSVEKAVAKKPLKLKAVALPPKGRKGGFGGYRWLSYGQYGHGMNGYGVIPAVKSMPDLKAAKKYLDALCKDMGDLEGYVSTQTNIDWDQMDPDDQAVLAWDHMYQREVVAVVNGLEKRFKESFGKREDLLWDLCHGIYKKTFMKTFKKYS